MKRILFTLLIVLAIPLIFNWTPLQVMKMRVFDSLIETPNESGNFIILNISEQDLEDFGGWPLPRDIFAQLHYALLEYGATGVAYGISFPQKDRMGGDQVFAQALNETGSVIAMFPDNSGEYPKTTSTIIKGEDIGGMMLEGVKENYLELRESSLQGLAFAPTEADLIVRRVPLLARSPDGWIPSFATQIYKLVTGSKNYIITTNQNGIQEIVIQGLNPVKTDSLGRKWISWVDTPEITLKELDKVKDRFVIVGVDAAGIQIQIPTPVGLKEPHKVQAALAESILIEDSPYIPDYAFGLEILIFLLSGALICVLASSFGVVGTLTSLTFTFALTASGGFWLIRSGLLIDVTYTLVSQFVIASTAFFLKFRQQYKLRQQIKKQFEKYLDKRQVARLQKNPSLLKLGGEKQYATFLFTDLRGFTSLSERVGPEKTCYIMNKALTAQVSAVQKYDGLVDKFIGDAMFAQFGPPLGLENHEEAALKTAMQIQNNIKLLNEELKKEKIAPVQIGIGIETGHAVVGNMGSETRFEYSAIGDPVNCAARYESATKGLGVDLVIGQRTQDGLKFNLTPLGMIEAKGKKDKLQVYTWE